MDYLSAVTELNYMTQIVIMLYEDNNKVRLCPVSILALFVVADICVDICICRTLPQRNVFTWSCTLAQG